MADLLFSNKKIFLNTIFQFTGRGLGLILTFLFSLLIRRYFGRAAYGDYVFIVSILLVFNTLSDFGTRLATVPQASKDKSLASAFIGSSIVLRFLLVVLAFNIYLALVLILSFNSNLSLALVVAGALLFVFWFKDTFYMIFTIKSVLHYQTIVELVTSFLTLMAALVTVWLKKELAFLFSLMVVLPILFLIWYWFKNKITKKIKLQWQRQSIKILLQKSLLVFISMMMFTLASQLPQMLLKFVKNNVSLGIYGLSYKIYENGLIPMALFMNVCLPIFTKLTSKSKEFLNSFLQKSFDVTMILSLTFSILMFGLAPLGVRVLTGSFLRPEINTIRLLSLVLGIAYLNHFFGFLFLGKHMLRELFYSKLIGFIVGLILVVPLLTKLSYYGAAFTILFIETSVLIYSWYICQRKIRFSPVIYHFPATLIKVIKSKGRILLS